MNAAHDMKERAVYRISVQGIRIYTNKGPDQAFVCKEQNIIGLHLRVAPACGTTLELV